MRPSSRNQILQAAVRVTERLGITALTLEAAAEEAGLTKAGLMYHFRTRDELLVGIQRHLTQEWEARLLEELGKPLEEASPAERARAYVLLSARDGASKADLAFMVESTTHPELAGIWEELAQRWVPEPAWSAATREGDADAVDAEHLDRYLARLAADGLWLSEATGRSPLPAGVREALGRRLARLTETPD